MIRIRVGYSIEKLNIILKFQKIRTNLRNKDTQYPFGLLIFGFFRFSNSFVGRRRQLSASIYLYILYSTYIAYFGFTRPKNTKTKNSWRRRLCLCHVPSRPRGEHVSYVGRQRQLSARIFFKKMKKRTERIETPRVSSF